MSEPISDVVFGVEMSLVAQEQVVADFRDLVEQDITTAVDRYTEFAEKLERASSDGNPQIRSMVGGPDSQSRASLVDIMVGNYASASDDVKMKIRNEVSRPLLRDNLFYVKMAIVKMTNPYVVGDIIRENPAANPGADYYEGNLLECGDARDLDLLQFWLDRFCHNMFAATTIALQKDQEENVVRVIANNEPLFGDAAHVAAATHDLFAEIQIARGSTVPKSELTERYRGDFVPAFSDMIIQKAEQARWLPLGSEVLQRYFG